MKKEFLFFLFAFYFTSCSVQKTPRLESLEETADEPEKSENTMSSPDSSDEPEESQVEKKNPDLPDFEFCKNLKQKWYSLSQKCKTNEDCVLIGYEGNCDCSFGISSVGRAFSRTEKSNAEKIHHRWIQECKPASHCHFDAKRGTNLRCSDGKCVVDLNGCL